MTKLKERSFLEYKTSKYTLKVTIQSEPKLVLVGNTGKMIKESKMEWCQEYILQSKYCET